jgi:hypothetical protein
MPVLETPQKGFYDSRRQFQGKDNPEREQPMTAPESRPPVAQLVVGAVFLVLITLAFFAFALPQKPVGLEGGKAPQPAVKK